MFPFPTTNVMIGEDGVLTVPAGKTVSGSIGIALSSEGLESEKTICWQSLWRKNLPK